MSHKTFFFLHIPKTAGSTLKTALNHVYKKNEIFHINNKVKKVSIHNGLKNLPIKKQKKLKMVIGHGYFGMHNVLQSDNQARYVTFLRNPEKRIISLYSQILNSDNHPIKDFIIKNDASLEDVIQSKRFKGFHNDQCRLIAGLPFDLNISNDELYEKAVNNIDNHFDFVGIQEKFDLSLLMLKEVIKWDKNPLYLNQNLSKQKKIKVTELNENTYKLIADYNAADIKLYKLINNRLNKKYIDSKDKYDTKMIQFIKMNQRHYTIYYPMYIAKKKLLLKLSEFKTLILEKISRTN